MTNVIGQETNCDKFGEDKNCKVNLMRLLIN